MFSLLPLAVAFPLVPGQLHPNLLARRSQACFNLPAERPPITHI
jgi:hypothetical protein